MAFNNEPGRAELTAASAQTVFTFPFKIFFESDLKVYQTVSGATPDEVADLQILNTDYTVVINGDLGGTITFIVPTVLNDAITIVRSLAINRFVEFQTNGDLRAVTLNSDQDYQTYLIADAKDSITKALRFPANSQGVDGELPFPVANSYIKWNADADALENDTAIPANVQLAIDSATAAGISETNSATQATSSQLKAWVAEAEAMTAESNAREAENVFTKTYTSLGNGNFSSVNNIWYSALHYQAKAIAGQTQKTSSRNAVISAPNGVHTINGTGLDYPIGLSITYAEGSDDSTGNIDPIETTSSALSIPLIAGAKNYFYVGKGGVAGSTIYPLIEAYPYVAPDANSDTYDVAEGIMYNTTGTPISRTYTGEATVDSGGEIITDTLVEYAVNKQRFTDVDVHGGFNLGRHWVDRTAERFNGVEYLNDSGQDKEVSVRFSSSVSTQNILVNLVAISPLGTAYQIDSKYAYVLNTTTSALVQGTIPRGYTYYALATSATIAKWYELNKG